MNFKVFWNVNSAKLSAFVKPINEWEKKNVAIPKSAPFIVLQLVCSEK
jgi:hypothetical protein